MTKQEAYQIASLCLQLLDRSDKWSRGDPFRSPCSISHDKQSLSCALELMSLSVTGEARSRSLIMRRVRWKIRRHFIWRHGWHPINNFNNHHMTTYDDIIFLLTTVRESLS